MRNAVVIGLGGTGSWVLAHLKQRLLTEHRYALLEGGRLGVASEEYNHPQWPVHLRALDIDPGSRPRVSGVKLEPNVEDVILTAPFGQVIEDFQATDRNGQECGFPTIASWLDPKEVQQWTFLDGMDDQDQADQIRQFSRVSFFLDVINGAPQLQRLEAPLRHLSAADSVLFVVVGSVAGGTGAGLLLDTLVYLNRMRRDTAGGPTVQTLGFLVLPSAFSGTIKQQEDKERVQANGYATLRELQRLLGDHHSVRFDWSQDRVGALMQPAIDFCFLVDGSREVDSAPNLEFFTPVEQGLHPAIADAILTHVLEDPQSDLGMDYAALNAGVLNQSERFASFGSYVLSYAWEPLLQSCAYRAAQASLAALLEQSPERAKDLAGNFLVAGAVGPFGLEETQQGMPPLVTEAVAGDFQRDRPIPSLAWLLPLEEHVPLQPTPVLREAWPELRRIRTNYDNSAVREGTEQLARDFVGEFRDMTATELTIGAPAPLLTGVSTNMARATTEFRRAIWAATCAVMGRNDSRGGVALASGFLAVVQARMEAFATYLAERNAINLQPHQERVDIAVSEMNDLRRMDDAMEQSEYLDARQALLEATVSNLTLTYCRQLVGRFHTIIELVRAEVRSWTDGLTLTMQVAEQERERIDEDRRCADRAPTRRFVPLPGDGVDDTLYAELWETADDDGVDGLLSVLRPLTWVISGLEGPESEIKLRGAFGVADRETPLTARAVTALTASRFPALRRRTVFDILDMLDQDAAALADELTVGGSKLSAWNPVGQAQAAQGVPIDRRHVWAAWPTTGLGESLRKGMDVRGFAIRGLEAHGASDACAHDKIVVFTSRHLVALGGFRGVEVLKDSYQRHREASPNPHVLPEERAAARIEAHSEELVQMGLLQAPLDELSPSATAYAAECDLLRSMAVCVAADRLVRRVDPPTNDVTWQIAEDAGPTQIGTDADFSMLLRRLRERHDQQEEVVSRRTIDAVAKALRMEDGIVDDLRNLALIGWGPAREVGLDPLIKYFGADAAESIMRLG